MFRYLTTALFTLFSCINIYAQTPSVEWHRSLGSNFSEYITSIQITSDGGSIVSGYSTGSDNGDVLGHHGNTTVGDIWILKLNKSGKIEWQKSLGGTDSEQSGFILETPDGGYIIAGGAASGGCGLTGNHGASDYWVVKLNNKGDILWQKQYGGSQDDVANSIALSADGGYFVAGFTVSDNGDVTGNHGGMDYWVIKIDAAGKLIWQKSLGGSGYDYASGIQSTADGGCIVAGSAESTDGNVTGSHGAGDGWVVKLDSKGNIIWQKAIGGSMSEQINSIQIAADGGYILAGTTNSHDGDVTGLHGQGFDAWVVKLESDGKIKWQKCYGGRENEHAKYIQNTPDGGYVFTGSSVSSDGDITCNAGSQDVLIMKINSNGILEWQKTAGGSDFDEGYCVQPLTDGSFMIAASASSPEIAGYHSPVGGPYDGKFDYWVIKLSAPVVTPYAPIVTIDRASGIICRGKQATINASVLYAGVSPRFQWLKNGITVGVNSPIYNDADLKENDQITCVVTNNSNCDNAGLSGSDVMTIKMKTRTQNPEITIIADNTSACNCATTTVKATIVNAGGSPDYKWMVNGNTTGINAAIFVSHKLKDGDVITCIYSDNTTCNINGSIVSNEIRIGGAGSATPSVTIAALSATVCKDSTITFTATTSNAGSNPTYQWKVNNVNTGNNSSVFSSAVIPAGATISCSIKVDPLFSCASVVSANSNSIVTNDNGCPSPGTGVINTGDYIKMPNAFTPNNDGSNDLFRVPARANIDLREFSIFDRWGNKVFSTADKGIGWNGTFNGKKQNSGVYIYFIKGKIDNKDIVVKGIFALVN